MFKGSITVTLLMMCRLCVYHYIAPPPIPSEGHQYNEPKLIDFWREEDSKLSDTIMMSTGEVGS